GSDAYTSDAMVLALVGEMATARRPHFPAMMLREVLAGGAHLAAEVVPHLVRVLGAVRRIAERGVRDGTLRPVDPLFTPPASDHARHVRELIARGLAADLRSPAAPPSHGAEA